MNHSNHSNETTVFLHIPKTAGTTLQRITARQVPAATYRFETEPDTFAELPQATRARIRFLFGHFPYGVHRSLSGRVTYLSMLRDPIRRVISLYRHARRDKAHNMHPRAIEMSLGEMIAAKSHKEALDNSQVRMISGIWDEVPFGGVDEEIYRLAVDRLESDFAVVGTTERFDESLLLMKRRLGWRRTEYIELNTAGKRPTQALDQADLDQVAAANTWDQKLVDRVNQRLTAEIDQIGPPFQAELAAMQRHNRRMQPFLRTWNRIYWEGVRTVSVREILAKWSG